MLSNSKYTWMLLFLLCLYSFTACTGILPGTQQITSTGPAATTTANTSSLTTTTPTATTAPSVTTPPTTQTPATFTGGDFVNYQLINSVPEQVQSTLESSKKTRGYLYFAAEKLLVIFMGERSTGGYSIQLQTIRRSGAELIVETVEKSPKPGDVVTQAFTYPRLIIQLEDQFTAFQIKDSTGSPYAKIQGVQY